MLRKLYNFVYQLPNVGDVRAQQLRQAQLDLLGAEQAAEYWLAHSAMLRRRVKRLSSRRTEV